MRKYICIEVNEEDKTFFKKLLTIYKRDILDSVFKYKYIHYNPSSKFYFGQIKADHEDFEVSYKEFVDMIVTGNIPKLPEKKEIKFKDLKVGEKFTFNNDRAECTKENSKSYGKLGIYSFIDCNGDKCFDYVEIDVAVCVDSK